MHIFLTGDVQVGKSTIINKTLAALKIERPGGFRSVSVPDLPDGAMSVYLLAAAEKAPAMGDFNCVGIRKGCGRGIEKFPQAFETAGVQALKNAEQSRLILMDEVGRMESAAAQFSARMEALLDGSVPILGVVQKIADTPLTNAIRTHPNVRVLTVTKENREQMAQEVLRLISKELDRTTDSAGAIVFRGDTVLMIRAGSRWSISEGACESPARRIGRRHRARRARRPASKRRFWKIIRCPFPRRGRTTAEPSGSIRRGIWQVTCARRKARSARQVGSRYRMRRRSTFAPDRAAFLKALEIMKISR